MVWGGRSLFAQQATVAPSTALRIPINNVRMGASRSMVQIEPLVKHLKSLAIIFSRCNNSTKYGNKRVTRNSQPASPSAILLRLIEKRLAHIKSNGFYHGSNLPY